MYRDLLAAAMLMAGTSIYLLRAVELAVPELAAETQAGELLAPPVERQFLPVRRQLRQHHHRSSIHLVPTPCLN
jgi:hypothetical protein